MRRRRFAVAAVITLAAVGVPCVAWYVAGSRAARQEAERVERGPLTAAQLESAQVARRLAVRLEALRQSETRRAFTDYGGHQHILPDRCDCDAWVPSPLAEGPADPLIWAHFQIDEVGQLTLPTFDPARRTAPDRERARLALSTEEAILEVLECAGSERLASLPRRDPAELTPDADDRVVTVGPFRWHTVVLGDEPALVALRTVATPAAVITQGFAIRGTDLVALVDSPDVPVSVRAGGPRQPAETQLPIEGAAWSVSVDASAAREQAEVVAARVVARFRRSFAVGVVAALLGAALVLGMLRQSESLARQRARFAASAAHELRTPLAGMRMYGEMLADGTGDPSQRERYARRVAGEAERLGRVVSNLLGFSRLERGELALKPETGDLGDAVREAVEQIRPGLEAAGAKIEVTVGPSDPARFDRDAVHQILQNLLDNAEKYTRDAADRTIRVEVDRTAAGLTLSVTDRGPGVEPSIQRRLFEAFVRHPSPDAPDGLGLGLTLVRALAEAQGARVDYVEALGGGARFTVTFAVAG